MDKSNIEDIYRLSPMQKGMLFHTLSAPESGVYFQQTVYTLHGDLDVSAFTRAWQRVVERHPILRTLFLWEHRDEPLQVVRRWVKLPWVQQDWRGLSPAEHHERLEVFLGADRDRGCELSRAPLMRLALIQVAEDAYHFIWSRHHLLLDMWSGSLALKEVFAFYKAFRQGEDLHLEPARPYRDYIAWLRQQDLSQAEAFWRQRLKGFTAPTALGVNRAPGSLPGQETVYGKQQLRLSPAVTAALQALAREHRLTLNTLVQGAWTLLLSRYSGGEDVVCGTTVSGRPADLAGVESMVGLFINTLPVRVQVSPRDSLLPWLKQLQDQMIELRAYQYSPVVQVHGWSEIPRSLPLFESILAFENSAAGGSLSELRGGLDVRIIRSEGGRTGYPLTTLALPGPQLLLRIIYDCRCFDAPTITRMLGHCQTMLEGIVADPEQRLSTLSLLTAAERQQMLVEWNDTKREYPKDQCIHQLFEAQAERTPDGVAVAFEDEQLTYRELNRRANQLAHHLQKLGVGPEVLVGICVERSLEMVVGLLGILKAGGAYVPLDPTYPHERLAFMLADTQTPVVLTQDRLLEDLPKSEAQVVCLDTGREAITCESQENPSSGATAGNLAYVLYTSGSTERPKGVAMHHRPLCNLISWQLQNSTLPGGVRTLQLSSLSFAVSFQEIFSTWCSGGTLVLISEGLRRDAVGLVHFLTDESVERLFLPFVALQQLAEVAADQGSILTSLREIVTAGEQLQITPHIASLFDKLEYCTLHNQYGPSESHVVTALSLTGSPGDWPVLPPIGRPIANTQVYVLDRHLQPVSVGVPGELYISGDSLAQGYLNRPELTAEKFIANPFRTEPGARLYKTGDLARYLPDGNIEFLGRLDHQVKIRGFRIELGEVEAVLGQHPAVRERVVAAWEDVPGDPSTPLTCACATGAGRTGKRLVAYVVPRQEPAPSVSELRSFLQTKLPDYMVPSAFVLLDALPLTANGRVNRRALPAPDQARPVLGQDFVPPRTPVEEVMAGVWAEVLGPKRVGIHDNFFELGGHSLQAMQLAAKMSAALNLDISVKFLFLHPSVAALADALEGLPPADRRSSRGHAESASPLVKIERRPLLSLFAAGKIAPVDAAALGSLPSELLVRTGLSRDEVIHGWYDNQPTLTAILKTFWGRIAVIRLPRFSAELYNDREDLVGVIVEALEIAGRLGARTVSCTGLIPSATDYGRAVATAISGRNDLPLISTGHATTVATVVLAINKILQEGGRDLAQERVGFLGLGSIGLTSLRLMLRCLPHPGTITLCDVYSKRASLETIRHELVRGLGFRGLVRVVEARAAVPPEFYDATLIVGATNVPDILDLTRVHPGTIIVDDSAPHCFALGDAVRRFREQADVLFTEGGALRSPHPVGQLRYVPRAAERMMNSAYWEVFSRPDPWRITGCILSSLLSSRFEDLKPTVGFVDDSACAQHYELLGQLRFQAADLHCGGYVLAEETIQNFRRRFRGASDPAYQV